MLGHVGNSFVLNYQLICIRDVWKQEAVVNGVSAKWQVDHGPQEFWLAEFWLATLSHMVLKFME